MTSHSSFTGQSMAFAVIVLGAVAIFAVGQAYQKFLDKANAPSINVCNPPTVNATVPLTIHTTNATKAESAHSTTVDSDKTTSCATAGPITSNRLSEDDIRKYIRKQKQIIQYVPSEQKAALQGDERLLARTMPNQGLKGNFGVHNAFTTYEQGVANNFKVAAKLKLQKSINIKPASADDVDGDWKVLVEYIRSTLESELSRPDEVINLAELIQFLTLKVSLRYLFPDQSGLEDREAVKYVAKTINILWIRSKAFRVNSNFATLAEQGWNYEHRLRDHLHSLTGANVDDQTQNPMNFILPAYETMWRAVFKGVLEVYFRDAPMQITWKQLLLDFLKDPSRAQFKAGKTSKSTSAIDVIKEVLRIYPPTRHVYRQFSSEPLGQFQKADIEACHRLPLLAQDNPEWFRPERWVEIRQRFEKDGEKQHDDQDGKGKKPSLQQFEEDLGFMPFATHCPAGKAITQGFGFKMVALLVGSTCEAFDKVNKKAKWKLEPESPSDVLPQLGQALKPSREDYLSLVYRKVADQSGGSDAREKKDGDAVDDRKVDVEVEQKDDTKHMASAEDDVE